MNIDLKTPLKRIYKHVYQSMIDHILSFLVAFYYSNELFEFPSREMRLWGQKGVRNAIFTIFPHIIVLRRMKIMFFVIRNIALYRA